jgi:RHS repeat-associated protein
LNGVTTNAAFKEYVFSNGKRIARRDSTNAVHYYFYDHLGSASMVTDALGTMSVCPTNSSLITGEDESDYYPFGGERQLCNRAPQNYKFTGKERDSESGLDNFGARYDSSSMGRWMIPDLPFADQNPENPQSWNLYGYVRNNPLNSIDTNGRVTWLIGGAWHKSKDYDASSPLGQEMAGFFDEDDKDVVEIPWSGENSASARAKLAANIVSAMKNHNWKPGEQNNVVCHNHGCNGLMAALPTLMADGYVVDNLVTLGQPMRGDYRFTSGSVDNWWNVSAPNDLVQPLGGRIPFFGGRTNRSAMNIFINTGKGPIGAHGTLHNDYLTRLAWELWIRNSGAAAHTPEAENPDPPKPAGRVGPGW